MKTLTFISAAAIALAVTLGLAPAESAVLESPPVEAVIAAACFDDPANCVTDATQAHRDCIEASPRGRDGQDARRACNDELGLALDACRAEGDCEFQCQATLDGNVSQCIIANDPSVCGGDPDCEADIIVQQNNCISGAEQNFEACVDGCGVGDLKEDD